MEKVIIENGGRVIEDTETAMYILQEDGFDSAIWQKRNEEDSAAQHYIHFRYI